MSLRKVGKYYWLDIRIKGKRIRRSLLTDNKFLALDRYKEKKDELLLEYTGNKTRFAAFKEQYLEWAWSSKPATAGLEEQRLAKVEEYFNNLEIIYLSDITPYHIEQLKAELKTWKISKKRTLSKATINRYLQLLRGMFYKAIEWEIYDKPNPLKRVRFYRENQRSRTLSEGQIHKIMQEAYSISQKPRSKLQELFHDLATVAINTGLRRSEILNLKWKNIYKDWIDVIGKGDKFRSVPLNLRAKAVIMRQPKKTEYVFDIPNRDQPGLFRRTVDTIRKRTEISFSFHDFRHYFATKLVEKGVDFITISEILGHSKIIVSLGYTHTDKERKRRAVELLNQ